jgi:hypothetical protein
MVRAKLRAIALILLGIVLAGCETIVCDGPTLNKP